MRVGNVQLSGPKSPKMYMFGYPWFTELHFGCYRIGGMCEHRTVDIRTFILGNFSPNPAKITIAIQR